MNRNIISVQFEVNLNRGYYEGTNVTLQQLNERRYNGHNVQNFGAVISRNVHAWKTRTEVMC